MIHFIEQDGDTFLVTRDLGNGVYETVHHRTGEVTRIENPEEIKAFTPRIDRDAVDFDKRGEDFVERLRERRVEELENYKKTKRKKTSTKKHTSGGKKSKKPTKKQEMALSKLPPELRQQIQKDLESIS